VSNALAIAGVTAVLQHYLNNVYNDPTVVLGTVAVSAVAPDIIQGTGIGSGKEKLQVNLFLHQVTFNAAWRNSNMPSLSPDGRTRLSNQPLALDLHYLLTAYAAEDSQAEALLGYAVFFLHQNPVIARNDIDLALAGPYPPTYSAAFGNALSLAGLADQLEMIKITPATLGREEIAWLWTALKADYRPTFPFQVSVVLMQPQNPLASSLPVLRRKVSAQPNILSPFPTLIEADPPNQQSVATLGDTITVQGVNLNGATGVTLTNQQRGIQQSITPLISPNDSSFQFTIPNPVLPPPQPNPPDFPVGVYLVTGLIASGTDTLQSNGVPLAIAPKIGSTWAPVTIASGPTVTVSVPCTPYLRPSQQVSLLIGSQEAQADAFTTPTNSPSFTFVPLVPTAQPVPVRLRVDGIDSPVVDMTSKPPKFAGPSVQVT
jgi:Pvc16 N-terminal domain